MTQAIFLSYASQDADAARRICEALRAAGLEVWFDQSELRGGDAWDASIRKQIKECALFVPVISANTNAREEGYFRLEWKLAVDRSHLMAENKAFFVPVILGDTAEATATVPDAFRTRQWTRISTEDHAREFAERVVKVLAGSGVQAKSGSMAKGHADGAPNDEFGARGDSSNPGRDGKLGIGKWIALAAIALVIGAAAWVALNKPSAIPTPKTESAATQSTPEVKALVAQVEALVRDPMTATRENYVLADELIQRVLKAEGNRAEHWMLAAHVSLRMIQMVYDRSDERRRTAAEQVERAQRLAPDAIQSKVLRMRLQCNSRSDAEALRLAEEILAKEPANRDALACSNYLARLQGRDAEADAFRARLKALEGGDPLSMLFDTMALYSRGMLFAAEKSYDELFALSPTRIVYYQGLNLRMYYFIDPNGAVGFSTRIPEKFLSEDAIGAIVAEALTMVGRGSDAVERLKRIPRDYIAEFGFDLPKGLLTGLAYEAAGQRAAATLEWRGALTLVEKRLTADAGNLPLLVAKAQLQALLGMKAEALESLRLRVELGGKASPVSMRQSVRVLVRSGKTNEAINLILREWPEARFLWRGTLVTDLLHMPEYAALRTDKRITSLIEAHRAVVKKARAPQTAGS